MRRIFVLFLMIVFSYAIDKAMILEMIKNDPNLLNNPQIKMLLMQKTQNEENNITIMNKIEFNETNETNLTEFNLTKEENLTKEFNITNPLIFKDPQKLIQEIQKNQQKFEDVKLKRFGEKFFYNKNELNKENIAVPDYYQVNSGDIVYIGIFGGEDKELKLKVDNEGNIYLPVLGPIKVAGLSVYELKKMIKERLKSTYPNYKIVVNLFANSIIQVNLTGYVLAPGVYNLSGLSTVKDLLIAANGFGDVGSMREVYLKRGGKVIKIIDFYKLIKNGEIVDNTLLRNGDIIYVPRAKKLIKVIGAVDNEAIYELKDNETLKDLFTYATLKPQASKKDIKIKRYINNNAVKIYYRSLNDNFELKNGDEVYVYKISELNQDYVEVYGNIEKPGSYELPKSHLLKDLLKKLSYLKDTYYGYGLIERFKGGVVSFSINNPKKIKLYKKDKIYIFNKYQILPNLYVKIDGEVVANPGKLRYLKGMSLKDAIFNAGLKNNFDKEKVKIVRYDDYMKPFTFFVNFNKNPDFKLKAYDEITLYKYTDFNPLKPIVVMGEVNSPNVYYYSDGLTLKDVIDIAGGFTYKADKNYIEIVRYKIVNGKRVRKILKISFNKNKNFKIYPYDEINVKTIPNWGDRKVVTIKGEVKYPGIYVIKTGERLASVIKRAGGYTKEAYLYAAVFTRESVRKMQEQRLKNMIYKLKKKVAIISASAKGAGERTLNAKELMDAIDTLATQAEKLKPIGRIALKLDRNLTKFEKSPYNITLENNDTLYIPSKKDSVIVMGEVLTPTAFVYTTKSALEYIKKAGGRTEMADEIYFVVHANGFTEKGNFGGWLDGDIDVKPGDAITVPIKIKTSTWYGIAKDISAIVYQLAITAASLKTVGAL